MPNLPKSPARFISICFLIFAAAAGLRGYRALTIPGYIQVPYGESVFIARSLVAGQGFSNPYVLPTGPTAHTAPIYPVMQAALLEISGPSGLGVAITTFAIVATSLNWALLPLLAIRLGLPFATGVLAGFAGALYPLSIDVDGSWETPVAGLLLNLLLIWTFRILGREGTLTTRDWLLFGIAFGLAVLLQPMLGLVGGVVALVLFARAWRTQSQPNWRVALIFAGIAICVLPWMIRNRVVLGFWAPVRDNLSLELRVSNHDFAEPDMAHNELRRDELTPHPEASRPEAMKVAAIGEAAYSRLCWNEFWTWTSHHRAEFVRLTLARVKLFWIPLRKNRVARVLDLIMLLSAAAGLAVLFRRNPYAGALIGLIWLAFPIVYYFVQTSERYSFPIRGTILVAACILPGLAFERLLNRRIASQTEATAAA